ncbi:partial Inner membrane protein YecN, partial [Patescibacteria group bacterium]
MITPIYAALLAIIFVFLSISTIKTRRELKIPLGDGKNQKLIKLIRAHSNFAEYVPFALLLIYMAEAQGAAKLLI